MRHLNYNHLLYFWTVAREGSVARAAESLHLTPQTVSGQLKQLEETVGEPLFQRVGRGLALTDTGRVVQQYADEIFLLGAELSQRVRNKSAGAPSALNVGIVNSIPKLIAYRILAPSLTGDEPVRVVCRENSLDELLAELAVHKLDLVLSDRPIPTGFSVRAYNHPLGESEISFFAAKRIWRRFSAGFPNSLDGAEVLLPVNTSALRVGLEDWFERANVAPRIVAEFDDSALMKAFGEAATGAFPAPSVIADEIEHMYRAKSIGVADGVSETYYAISPERKLKDEAVVRITEAARKVLSN